MCNVFVYKVVGLVGGGSVINGAIRRIMILDNKQHYLSTNI